jgi:hypothetical protein
MALVSLFKHFKLQNSVFQVWPHPLQGNTHEKLLAT